MTLVINTKYVSKSVYWYFGQCNQTVFIVAMLNIPWHTSRNLDKPLSSDSATGCKMTVLYKPCLLLEKKLQSSSVPQFRMEIYVPFS